MAAGRAAARGASKAAAREAEQPKGRAAEREEADAPAGPKVNPVLGLVSVILGAITFACGAFVAATAPPADRYTRQVSDLAAAAASVKSEAEAARDAVRDQIDRNVQVMATSTRETNMKVLDSAIKNAAPLVDRAVDDFFKRQAASSSGGTADFFATHCKRIAERAWPSVVKVIVPDVGTGSGHIFTEDGYIVTNFHVVELTPQVVIRLFNGEQVMATRIGGDPENDCCVVKIEERFMPKVKEWLGPNYTLPWGNSDELVAGDLVLAMGAPVGLHNTVSVGEVTAPRRYMLYGDRVSLEPYGIQAGRCINYIQHDAPINGGNSGGPLLNSKGQVVGMNTLGHTGRSGLAFAEPSNYVRAVAQNLIDCAREKYKYPVKRGWAGLEFDTFVDVVDPELSGLKVIEVFKYSPADAAHLKKGDVIVAINGKAVSPRTKEDIAPIQQLIAAGSGTTMTFTVLQGADRKDIAIPIPAAHPLDSYEFEALYWALVVVNNSETVARNAGVSETTGVYVEANSVPGIVVSPFGGFTYRNPNQPWTNSTLATGDVITAIDGQPVANVAEFFDMYLKNIRGQRPVVRLTIVGKDGRKREATYDPKKR